MCGIAGIVATRREVVEAVLPAMTDAVRHRGPDDSGQAIVDVGANVLGLGHRRLSIIDLSPAGHQPMQNPQTGDLIIFNGEIYNFPALREELLREGVQFAGHSDTEVLLYGLRRWGAAYIDRLEGMYALAWFDRPNCRLLLARDPVGIKPLYFAWRGDVLLFASEVRAIVASELVPRRLERRAVAGLLAYGAVQEPFTIFEGVEALPAGCWQSIDLKRTGRAAAGRAQRYWTFPEPDPSMDEPQAIERLQATFEAAARDHLISDVPVGVFLSSGLDSTIIASLAARHTDRLRTFTVGFADQPHMSESAAAAETARRIGAEHTDIQINGPDALAACQAWMSSLDQPSADGLNTYVISKAVRSQGIIVALSGLGGDELFGGYGSFSLVPKVARLIRYVSWVPAGVRRALVGAATVGRPESFRQKAADIASAGGGTLPLFLQARRLLSNAELAELGVPAAQSGLTADFVPECVIDELRPDDADRIAALSRMESRLYMGNMLLRDSDANGMAHGLEIRVPALDRRMLDFGHAIPGPVRRPVPTVEKHLLRKAFAPLLRPELTDQAKKGFQLPVGEWMVGPLRDLCVTGLNAVKESRMLRDDAVETIWQTFLSEPARHRWARVMVLVVLGMYMNRLGADAGAHVEM